MVRRRARILIIWSHLPSYLAACIRSLLSDQEAEVCLIVSRNDTNPNHADLLPYSTFRYFSPPAVDVTKESAVEQTIAEFRPDIVLAGCRKWGLLKRLAEKASRHGGISIWAVDNYWRGSCKDHASRVLVGSGLVCKFFDAVWVPGQWGRTYARRMGFENGRIFDGLYTCDTSRFGAVGARRFTGDGNAAWPRRFLFIGQYIQRKNVSTLIEAYKLYRARVADPWELWCAGRGPLTDLLRGQTGLIDHGFQDAKGCAELMGQVGTFVIPSWVDHWPLVIHEAVSAGLPVLCSNTCGSMVELVREGYNGYRFPPSDVKALSLLMEHMSTNVDAVRFGRNSLEISHQFSPAMWGSTLIRDIPMRLGRSLAVANGD